MLKSILLSSMLVGSLFASNARADLLRFATGYSSQAATAGNPGLVSGAAFAPITTYSLTAFELTITERTRIDQFAFVGNTPTPTLFPFSVMVHSSLAAFSANPLGADVYGATVWTINSQEAFGAGGGAGGMAWDYFTLVNPPGLDIVLDPGTYAITIYRDANWRFADSDIDLGTDWLASDGIPGVFAWEQFRPSGTAAIDVYGTVGPAPGAAALLMFGFAAATRRRR
jgi:hypothetical protein